MLKRTNYISGTTGLLIGLVLLTVPSAAQELAWYQRAPYDPATQTGDVVKAVFGVEQGLLVAGRVDSASGRIGEYLRLLDGDGRELWRLDLPPTGRSAGKYVQSFTPLITPHADGGWWFVAKFVESRTTPQADFFVRYHISSDGRILSSTEADGEPVLVTADGTIIELVADNWIYTWRMIDPDDGTVDSVSFDMEPVGTSMKGEPSIAWSETTSDRAYILFTNAILGECLLVSIDLATGQTQSVRLDDVPTVGLSGAVTSDGSVVILGRETRWREGDLNDLVLIRPGIEGGAYDRVRLPIGSAYTPTLYGIMDNGDVIFSPSTQVVDNRIYRISPDGSSISYLQFIAVSNWYLSIAPNDAIYMFWGGQRFGKVTGTGPTSSVSDEDESDHRWIELDLSSAFSDS